MELVSCRQNYKGEIFMLRLRDDMIMRSYSPVIHPFEGTFIRRSISFFLADYLFVTKERKFLKWKFRISSHTRELYQHVMDDVFYDPFIVTETGIRQFPKFNKRVHLFY